MATATCTKRTATDIAHGWLASLRAWPVGVTRWWRIGRHYHPERRYMRGARPTG